MSSLSDESAGVTLLTLALLVFLALLPSILGWFHPPSRETDLTRAYSSLSKESYQDVYQHAVADADDLAHGKIPEPLRGGTDNDTLYFGRRPLIGDLQLSNDVAQFDLKSTP